jgi:hypothetical protein
MQALGQQNQELQVLTGLSSSPHYRRTRRGHRGDGLRISARLLPGGLLGNNATQLLESSGNIVLLMSSPGTPLSRLQELKARKFTLADRGERVARSLAALQEPGSIRLNEEDWRWLDEHSSIEDELD